MKGSPRVAGILGVVKVLAIDFWPVFRSPWLPLQGKGMILYQVRDRNFSKEGQQFQQNP